MRNFIMLVVSCAIILAIGLGPQVFPGVADNLIAPRHGMLRQTATECGPYDMIEDAGVTQDLRDGTTETVANYFPGASIVSYEAVTSHCTPTEIGNKLQKLAQNFGSDLQLVESDGEGSFLTLIVRTPRSAVFFALIVHGDGTMLVVADLEIVNEEAQG
jgi:hypothetical protein